jgi:predicted RND superfamily exporter protein
MASTSLPPEAWQRFQGFVIRHRVAALLLSAGLTLVSLGLAPAVETTGDATEHIPKGDPAVRAWLDVTNRFGGLGVLMVGLEEPDRPLTFEGLSRLARITDALSERKGEGVLSARSLTNVPTTQEGEDDTLVAEPMVPAIPRDADGLAALSARILADTQVPGSLVSRDLRGYVVLVRVDPRKDARAVASMVRDVVEADRGPMGAYYFGAPFVSNLISREVYAKLAWVVPLFAIGLLGVLWLRVRRFRLALVVLGGSGLPLLWWLAALDAAGIPLTLAAVTGALLLLVIGSLTYARIGERWLSGSLGPCSGRAVLLLFLAAVAFGALASWHQGLPAALPYLARFGEALVVGLLAVIAVAVLAIVPAVSFFRPVQPGDPGVPRAARPAAVIARRVAVFLAAAAGLAGATQMRFAISMPDMFAKGDEVGSMLAFFERRFGGQDFIQVDVAGDLRDPGVVARLVRFTDLLEGAGVCSDVRSVTQVLSFVAHGVTGLYRIPDDREAVNNIWFFLEGSEDVRSLVQDDRREAMVVCRVPASRTDVARVRAAIDDAIARSATVSAPTTTARILAAASVHGLKLPEDRVLAVVAAAMQPDDSAATAARSEEVLREIERYLASPSSPFSPTAEEWARIAGVLRRPPATDPVGAMVRVIAGLPSFVEIARPELAPEVAQTLLRRSSDIGLSMRAASLDARLFESPSSASVPQALRARVRGVLADAIAGAPPGGDQAAFSVTGFPVLGARIEGQLMRGLRVSLGIVTGLLAVLSMVVARRRWRDGLRTAADVVATALITLGTGWALGIEVDPGSASLYLLAPVAAFLLSPGLDALGPVRERPARYPAAFALALAAAALSLLPTMVMPVIRVGGVMAIGLLTAVLVTSREHT